MRRLVQFLVGADRQRATITFVNDPTRPFRLVHAVGVLDGRSIHELLGSLGDVPAPHQIHLDVQDACIADATTMSRLESALDRLERRRVEVRVVGLDPQHPAIAR